MAYLNAIVSWLDTYLDTARIKDRSYNGLQFEGSAQVRRVMFAVDAGVETISRAVSEKADMIIVHHGHFWANTNPSIAGPIKKRIDLLYRHNISLYASHLPLDLHPVVGNNAQLITLLGATISGPFCDYHGVCISHIGSFKKALPLNAVVKRIEKGLDTRCTVLPFGPKKIRTMAPISGGGGYSGFDEAVARGVDLYLSGDSVEIYHTARDLGINVIFAGHHATETVGVRALLGVLKKKFPVETVWVDIPTGL